MNVSCSSKVFQKVPKDAIPYFLSVVHLHFHCQYFTFIAVTHCFVSPEVLFL